MTAFKIGDRVRVAADAAEVNFGDGAVIGTVTEADSLKSNFKQYIDQNRVQVLADDVEYDQWVRPGDLTLVEVPDGGEPNWSKIAQAHRNLSTLAFSLHEQITARNEALRKLAQADENIAHVTGNIEESRVELAALEAEQ